MSWIKQMFAKVMNDHDENIEVNKKVNEPKSEKLNMRMTYQYPKNNFRFPLIDHVPKNEEVLKKKEGEEKNRPKRQDNNYRHEKQKDAHRKKIESNRKIEPINTQPFRPTEIPSPIYGYQPPPKRNDKTLEYELQDYFLQDKKEEDSQEKPKINDDVVVTDFFQQEVPQAFPITIADEELDLSDGLELYDNLDEVDEIIPEEIVMESEQYISLTEKNLPNLFNQQEFNMADEEVAVNEEVEVAEEEIPVNEEIETVEEDVPVNEEIEMAEEEIPVNQENETVEEDVSVNPEIDTSAEEMLVHQKSELVETVEALDYHVIEMEEEKASVHQEIETLEDDVVSLQEIELAEEESSATFEEVEAHKEEIRTKKRPQMPFNVLMLKEDREKWQQKKREKDREEAVPSIANKEPLIKHYSNEDEAYKIPPLQLLHPPVIMDENREWLEEQSNLLNETLNNFNVKARVVHVSQGPSVTRFEVQPDPGVKVSRITNLSDDIKLSMAAKDIRIEAPIPGKRSVGIELPNLKSRPVQISEILGYSSFQGSDSPLTAALGLDISGDPVITDLRRMPHGLIAGATGSGKSVCINSILVSLLYKATPDELKLLLIDPKMVELAPYNHIPHLVSPVITDVKAATAALKWTVDEMERRYELFAHGNVRDIHRFNKIAKEKGKFSEVLPYIVVVIDELADLMMMAPADVEESICRIAQKARACGIHLLIATQRPSVDVITGLIKANVPTRVAFSVSSQVDSRTIIDISGAEKLLGRGDMLFLDSGSSKPIRLQGTFVSDEEIDRVIDHVRSQGEPNYLFEQEELLKKAQTQEDEDELFMESCEFIVSQGSASTSLLQRHFRIGYNRAARLIFMMEERGLISEARGSKARDVLIGEKELTELKETTHF